MPAYNTYKSTMKKNTFLILSLLLLYLYPLSASVEIRSNKLTTGDGLANNSTRYMMQDSKGFIWLGTLNGLSYYDGNSFAWNDLYEIVARANMFLSKTDGVTFSDEKIKNQFIGEAKFLRALAYFDLVRYFGHIPIVLEPVSVNEAMTIKQSKQVDVYETAIVPDLEDAVRKLVDTPLNYQGNNASAGRATLAAAKSLLGRVYLTMAGYPVQDESKKALAEQLFSEVIDYARANNKYWAQTGDEWQKVWISDNDNKYHIFEIQYIASKNYGNPMVFNSVPQVNDSYTKLEMSGNRIWCEARLAGRFKLMDTEGVSLDCLLYTSPSPRDS